MTHSSRLRTFALVAATAFIPSVALSSTVVIRNARPSGPFTASYSGTLKTKACTIYMKNGKDTFKGSGTATGLGSSNEKATVKFNANFYCIASGGKGTLSSSTSKDKIKVTVGGNPCTYPVSFTITGGSGKFVNASGSGTLSAVCTSNSYTDSWSGTFTY